MKQFFLQAAILILAVSYAAGKAASVCMSRYGLFSLPCMGLIALYLILTAVYAVAWQHSLETFELSFLYTNRSFYMIWTQIIAVNFFGDQLYINNFLGLMLIFAGVWVNARDVS